RCWISSSTDGLRGCARPRRPVEDRGAGLPAVMPPAKWRSQRRNGDAAVLDLDQVDVGLALAALLPGVAGLGEADRPVEPDEVDRPERLGDRGRIGRARLLDGVRDRADAVVAAEALG